MPKAFVVSAILCLSVISFSSYSQNQQDKFQRLRHYEDSLRILSDQLLDGGEQGVRQEACYDFIKMLVKALKTENSFDYPFDSLKRISILYPEDKSFRIFNWHVPLTSGKQRYYGAIQMKSNTHLEIFPLFDNSDYMLHPSDTVTDHHGWYGALYYKIMQVKGNGKNYYMLFGWDGNTIRSNKKILDVLWFNKNKEPMFGADIFSFGNQAERKPIKRLIIEYKEDAQVSINYDEELKLIVFDHLVPQDPSTKDLPFTYIPDGSYEAFEWKKGKWNYIENVFTSTMKEPVFPNEVDFEKKKLYK